MTRPAAVKSTSDSPAMSPRPARAVSAYRTNKRLSRSGSGRLSSTAKPIPVSRCGGRQQQAVAANAPQPPQERDNVKAEHVECASEQPHLAAKPVARSRCRSGKVSRSRHPRR